MACLPGWRTGEATPAQRALAGACNAKQPADWVREGQVCRPLLLWSGGGSVCAPPFLAQHAMFVCSFWGAIAWMDSQLCVQVLHVFGATKRVSV